MIRVMGVLNVTPDSFSDGGRWLDADAAIAHGRQMITEGADVIDVGGESTRPGAVPVDQDEEVRRVIPVIKALAGETVISVDTRKEWVAREAVAAGATIINDVSASLWKVAADTGAEWVAMHMPADPSVMQSQANYRDVVAEVCAYLVERAETARADGVIRVWIDPGIGFGKTADHNLSLLRHLDQLVATGFPVLVGTSRKAFLGPLSAGPRPGRSAGPLTLAAAMPATATPATPSTPATPPAVTPPPVTPPAVAPTPATPTPADRLEATVATSTLAALAGAQMIRVHDVRPAVMAAQLIGTRPEEGVA